MNFGSTVTAYEPTLGDDGAYHSHQLDPAPGRQTRDVEQRSSTRTNQNNITVDRNTSIRSVLTLPAYRFVASHNEQVLGREGERDGVDTVVEFPTEQDEEELREQEMNAMYQLRQTRRLQAEARDESRRLRREAERRGDSRTAAQIRNRDRATSSTNNNAVEALRRDIERAKDIRQRTVSSVSYADLGVARHDGTRIRASSQESERLGLLAEAADMSGLSVRSGAHSPAMHGRHRSGSSVGSFDSDFPSPTYTRPRGDSRPTTPSRLFETRAGSSPELVESDLGVEVMPPPEYVDVSLDDDDDAERSTTPMHDAPPPDYPGPYRTSSQRSQQVMGNNQETTSSEENGTPRGRSVIPQLPSLRLSRLPQIRIEEPSAHP